MADRASDVHTKWQALSSHDVSTSPTDRWLHGIDLQLWECCKTWFLLLTRRKKVKASYQHHTEITRGSLSGNEWSMCRAIIMSPIIDFWLHDITGCAKKWNGEKCDAPRLCSSCGSQRTDIYRLGFPSPNSKRTFLNSNKCSSYSFGHRENLILMLLWSLNHYASNLSLQT